MSNRLRKIDILIADDHPAVRLGIRSILQLEKNLNVVGEAKNGEELLKMMEGKRVDLVFIDLNMPGKNGLETTRKLRKYYPKLKILAFSIYDDQHKVLSMLKSGADGYLLKAAESNEVVDAISAVMKGEHYISKEIAHKVILDVVAGNMPPTIEEEATEPNALSKREEEILSMLANDNSYSEVAQKLHISKRTVDTHRYNISKKLGIKTIAGLIRYAINHNLA
ncbi:MAG: response regulator transcription factor [Chitinophagales bacterium]|nr:response regulator transcription factor [Chitinophagales bacterium]